MKKDTLILSLIAIVSTVAILFSACRKINDYTEVGGGLIPPIDNINTFDTTITVQTFNDSFQFSGDSLYTLKSDEQFVGLINNDPLFGKTDARMFFELKNPYYGSYPLSRKDSVKIDSIVMVLTYVERYGDSTIPQQFKVYEITNPQMVADSYYLVRREHFLYNPANVLNEQPVQALDLRKFDDSVKVFRDTSANQIRIRLDTNFARRLVNYDTTNAYKNDTIFKTFFKGFALRSEGAGNAVVGVNIGATTTRLAIYYRAPKTAGGGIDTAVSYLYFTPNSSSANYIKRDYSGSAFQTVAGTGVQTPVAYIQKSPGTYVTVKVPALPTLSNRVVHRAELIVEQLYDASDAKFPAPDRLYLDAPDPTLTSSYKFRTIPYSLDISTISGFDFINFGVNPIASKDVNGNDIKVWKFNLSRYIQHVVNGTEPVYDFRLYAPMTIRGTARYQGSTLETSSFPATYLNGNTTIGRVRVGGGNHPTQRMRLRIIYSKL
ncbi:MAG: DUF4270 family protein [Chitinophagaceae bacterium]|nr:DUF4270 family protein [Chitinophagaceae bacterium]